MKRAEANALTGFHSELDDQGLQPVDWIRLLSFYKCMGKKCHIIFQGEETTKTEEGVKKMAELIDQASPAVQELLQQSESKAQPGKNPVNKARAEEIASKMNRSQTIFAKPKETSYLAVVPQQELEDFETWWRYTCLQKFRINTLRANDPSVTEEIEKEEFRRQLTRSK